MELLKPMNIVKITAKTLSGVTEFKGILVEVTDKDFTIIELYQFGSPELVSYLIDDIKEVELLICSEAEKNVLKIACSLYQNVLCVEKEIEILKLKKASESNKFEQYLKNNWKSEQVNKSDSRI
ncbi:hypothetical protein JOD82_001859 [Paenibacillus sp. 1182]|uniref:hypothetical protein n=1 Tax=Paenibacillus sp. 1182 TaxID=2806565 RepID=UPI001AE7BA30|nr:hypothetical protein [Paenibacillus sp. 1182]MBP1308839.1 hypothetical protein [Paenibacillus sp. 1182]